MIFDTDYLIAYAKGSQALSKAKALAFLDTVAAAEHPYISVVTWMEFIAGYESASDAAPQLSRFTLLPFSGNLWWGASRIMRDLGQRGERIGTPDCMIAATALAYGQAVVTLNRRHFERVMGLRVVIPS